MQIVRISPKNSFNPFDPLFTELFEPLRLKVSAGPSYNLILIIILCISSLNRIKSHVNPERFARVPWFRGKHFVVSSRTGVDSFKMMLPRYIFIDKCMSMHFVFTDDLINMVKPPRNGSNQYPRASKHLEEMINIRL